MLSSRGEVSSHPTRRPLPGQTVPRPSDVQDLRGRSLTPTCEAGRQTPSSPLPHDSFSPNPGNPSSRQLPTLDRNLPPLQEYHSAFSDEDLGSPSIRLSTHRRQQSFPSLLPQVLRPRTPSPTKLAPRSGEEMPLTGDGRFGKPESPRGILATWLSGKAAEDRVPSPGRRSNQTSPDSTPTASRTRQQQQQQQQQLPGNADSPSAKSTASTTASRFMSALSRLTQAPSSPTLDDELCNLDIQAALFPGGSPVDRDAFSPAAFKNLQANATGLLLKMQNAYRQRLVALRDLEAEKAAQQDELEEAQTRAEHLKMQLEGMARKAAEQEEAMQQLMDQLMAEKKARAEEKLARERALVVLPEGSMVSEDLGAEDDQMRRRWRKSGGTVKSDTGFETDEESVESESIFSRSRSPTLPSSTFDGSVADGPPAAGSTSATAARASSVQAKAGMSHPSKARVGTQLSAFQKIIKGISGDSVQEDGPSVCRNCRGQDASVAWSTVSLLRDENKHLKQRVSQLEIAVEGALDMVNGIGL